MVHDPGGGGRLTSHDEMQKLRPAAEDAFESFQHFTRQQLNLQKEVRPRGDSLGDGDGDGWKLVRMCSNVIVIGFVCDCDSPKL